jgi:hypothetical protein
MVDASQLSDEELSKVIETGEEPQPVVPTPEAPEPETEPAVQEDGEEQAPEPEQEEAPEEPQAKADLIDTEQPPSKRLLTRAQKLVEKYGTPPQKTAPRPQGLNYEAELDADPEVIKKLEADRQAASQSSYNEGLKVAESIEFRTNIKLDLPTVKPILDRLDPRDAEVLDAEYLKVTGFDPETGFVANPNIGYAEFIEARVELAERMAKSLNQETVKNIAKQTAQTGLRPDGSSAKRLNLNRDPKEMTMEELYASIGQTPPK